MSALHVGFLLKAACDLKQPNAYNHRVTDEASRPTVVFRPLAERGQNEYIRRNFGRLKMTDYGDHVEWTDGKRTTSMRLPDQRNGDPSLPVMTTVLISSFRATVSYAPGALVEARVRFLDEAGAVIAWFGPRSFTAIRVVEQLLPDEAFSGLQARGVRLEREVFTSNKKYLDDHPDRRIQGAQRAFVQHPAVVIGIPLLLFCAVLYVILTVF
jgi:hypothetical protein